MPNKFNTSSKASLSNPKSAYIILKIIISTTSIDDTTCGKFGNKGFISLAYPTISLIFLSKNTFTSNMYSFVVIIKYCVKLYDNLYPSFIRTLFN